MTRPCLILAALAALALTAAAGASPMPRETAGEDPAVTRGRDYAAANCSGCHNINMSGPSSFRAAPEFRHLPHQISAPGLKQRLATLLGREHYGMPRQFITSAEADDLVAFIRTLQAPGAKEQGANATPCVATGWC